jgi:hypothetical protein
VGTGKHEATGGLSISGKSRMVMIWIAFRTLTSFKSQWLATPKVLY